MCNARIIILAVLDKPKTSGECEQSENVRQIDSNTKTKMEISSHQKETSSSIAHLEYLRALTKHYQQQNFQNHPQSTSLSAYQELLIQQQQKHHQQQQLLQLNQRRSMEDVLKKLATVGREGMDPKAGKIYDNEHSRYFINS